MVIRATYNQAAIYVVVYTRDFLLVTLEHSKMLEFTILEIYVGERAMIEFATYEWACDKHGIVEVCMVQAAVVEDCTLNLYSRKIDRA